MSQLTRAETAEIREAFYTLERQFGAEAVIEEFEMVREYDEKFKEADSR